MSEEDGFLGSPLNRRDFIKTSALLGGTAAFAAQVPWLLDGFDGGSRRSIEPNAEYTQARPENIIYSACQQCNGQCGIKVKLDDGVAHGRVRGQVTIAGARPTRRPVPRR